MLGVKKNIERQYRNLPARGHEKTCGWLCKGLPSRAVPGSLVADLAIKESFDGSPLVEPNSKDDRFKP
ncbi:MAG: hypothetical protein GX364_04360 [Firmicutes bacterium]|nr:hypothetical protein [Bacillota bacterium]